MSRVSLGRYTFFNELQPCVSQWEPVVALISGVVRSASWVKIRTHPIRLREALCQEPKDDAADGIGEAALRPTIRFAPLKSEETQGALIVFRARELLIQQRTQAINALHGHLGELGQIAPQGQARRQS